MTEENFPQRKEENKDIDSDKGSSIKKVIQEFSMMGTFGRSVPYEKIMTSEHLSKIIENSDKESERDYQNRKSIRLYVFISFIFVLGFVLGLIHLLAKVNPSLLMNILIAIISFAGGAFGGYGVGKNKNFDD